MAETDGALGGVRAVNGDKRREISEKLDVKDAPCIGIVGGGPAGIATFAYLIRDLPYGSRVYIFNRNGSFGPGVAYDIQLPPCFTINHECDFMGGFGLSGKLGESNVDFLRWLVNSRERPVITDYIRKWTIKGFPEYMDRLETYLEELSHKNLDELDSATRKAFYLPRSLYGVYVQEAHKHHKAVAEAMGITCNEIVADVVDAQETSDRCVIEYRPFFNGKTRTLITDTIALTIGHWHMPVPEHLAGMRNYYHRVYAPELWEEKGLRGNLKGKRVAILGAGLAAIDATVAALEIGGAEHVTLVSRHGKLREIRRDGGHHTLRYLTLDALEEDARRHDGYFRLSEVLRLGRKELQENVYGHISMVWEDVLREGFSPSDPRSFYAARVSEAESETVLGRQAPWRSFLDALGRPDEKRDDGIPIREHIYRRLRPEDRAEFMDKYYSSWLSFQAPMPPPTMRKILRWMNEPLPGVETARFRLEIRKGTIVPQSGRFRIADADKVIGEGIEPFDVLMNATGQTRSAGSVPLVAAMLRSRQVRLNIVGGIAADPVCYRIRGKKRLHVIGPLMLGEQLIINSITTVANARSAAESMMNCVTSSGRMRGGRGRLG